MDKFDLLAIDTIAVQVAQIDGRANLHEATASIRSSGTDALLIIESPVNG
ncbi:MAG: hypothetical protein ABGX41_05045 [Pseudohongiella sp.]